ncbi:MAG: hypothetical protein H6767_05315 [Candidatus Peribacteria bacterium]|nr:MAG: hypothetical protein H6767_05315 [Candidatus Peribacteria bacterium]
MDTRSIPEKLGGPVSHGGVDSPEQVTTVYQLITAMEEHAERYAISKDWIERKYKQGSIEMQALHALFS